MQERAARLHLAAAHVAGLRARRARYLSAAPGSGALHVAALRAAHHRIATGANTRALDGTRFARALNGADATLQSAVDLARRGVRTVDTVGAGVGPALHLARHVVGAHGCAGFAVDALNHTHPCLAAAVGRAACTHLARGLAWRARAASIASVASGARRARAAAASACDRDVAAAACGSRRMRAAAANAGRTAVRSASVACGARWRTAGSASVRHARRAAARAREANRIARADPTVEPQRLAVGVTRALRRIIPEQQRAA